MPPRIENGGAVALEVQVQGEVLVGEGGAADGFVGKGARDGVEGGGVHGGDVLSCVLDRSCALDRWVGLGAGPVVAGRRRPRVTP